MSCQPAIRRRLGLALAQLICAPDYTLSLSKISYLIFVCVFSLAMAEKQPDDPLLWLVYGATVGGVEVAKKYISSRYIGPPSSPPSGPGVAPVGDAHES